jgi:hypothetical protein
VKREAIDACLPISLQRSLVGRRQGDDVAGAEWSLSSSMYILMAAIIAAMVFFSIGLFISSMPVATAPEV